MYQVFGCKQDSILCIYNSKLRFLWVVKFHHDWHQEKTTSCTKDLFWKKISQTNHIPSIIKGENVQIAILRP
jgi:hypothetical protein